MWFTFSVALLLVAVPLALWFWVTQPLLREGRSAAAGVEPARLETHVRALALDFFPRDYAHAENLDRAARYVAEEFARAGGAVTEQRFEAAGKTYRNVVARFGPGGGSRVIVGAHYDAAGELPGADDNASGVAGLLELARLLGRERPPAPVELVAFALEEPPFFRTRQMGSYVHASSLKAEGAAVRLMISLEMIGYFSDAPGSQQFPHPSLRALYPSEGNFISVVGTMGEAGAVRRVKAAMAGATPLPVYSINAPRSVPGVDFSDQLNYWDQGFDALMITDTAFYRNPNYHAASDTPDTLDYARMAMVVEGVYAAVLAEAAR